MTEEIPKAAADKKETCPDCDLTAELVAERSIGQDLLVLTFRCANGHTFSMITPKE